MYAIRSYYVVGTLFLFIFTANILGIVPGFFPPTGSFSTTVALAICVFIAVPIYGITSRITSYNVCYTKLLRIGLDAPLVREQVLLGDIDGHVGGEVSKVAEQEPCFQAGPGAELDQARVFAAKRGHLPDVRMHDAELGVGQVRNNFV